MHLPDGIIPLSVSLGGYAVAGAATWLSLRQISRQDDPRRGIPRASLLTSAFFAASLLHIPLPPLSVHLQLAGLLGVLLGWFAFPAILVGLFLQAIAFRHGGLTTLGLNSCLIGLPAMLSFQLFRLRRLPVANMAKPVPSALLAFLAGALPVALGALLTALLLTATIPAYLDASVERSAVTLMVAAHLPVAVLEGIFTAMVFLFLLRVRPGLLELGH